MPYPVRAVLVRELAKTLSLKKSSDGRTQFEHEIVGSTPPGRVMRPFVPFAILANESTVAQENERRRKTRFQSSGFIRIRTPEQFVADQTTEGKEIERILAEHAGKKLFDQVFLRTSILNEEGELHGLPRVWGLLIRTKDMAEAITITACTHRKLISQFKLDAVVPIAYVGERRVANLVEDFEDMDPTFRMSGDPSQTEVLTSDIRTKMRYGRYPITHIAIDTNDPEGHLSLATSILREIGFTVTVMPPKKFEVTAAPTIIITDNHIPASVKPRDGVIYVNDVETTELNKGGVYAVVQRGKMFVSDLLGMIDLFAYP